ncbi:MAG: hypothetical protein LC102_05335 [Ignavibacteriales bacterium]|nr:hypothetical protein [Ignavibacteriaceae bacterium]MBW7873189.1 hypothetical protein [Ignavibacteria bacterium]MBZ0196232.1 hypothetical protein [Ignavibacteriaceae bacterium]MCZ2142831.1 hypothetical protein [Ignavibacteriales bacterium]WKZ71405.1 MAG: hypothetical protein QY308_07190 [Ignavibacteriaceae bacterium]
MSGKIFADSANIVQDQAKILFDYYKNAAEAIVSEEERIEADIRSLEKDLEIIKPQHQQNLLLSRIGIGAGALGLVLGVLGAIIAATVLLVLGIIILIGGLVFAFLKNNAAKENQLQLQRIEKKILEQKENHKNIFRDYKVTKLCVGYVPVAEQIPYENNSFIVDFTNHASDSKFNLQILNDPNLFSEKIEEIHQLIEEAPVVETAEESEEIDTTEYSTSIQKINYNDYSGKLDRSLRTASYCLSDLNVTTVTLPIVMPESEHARFLRSYATDEPATSYRLKPFDTEKHKEEVDHFKELNELKKSLEKQSVSFENVLKNLMGNVAGSIQAITTLKLASTNKLVEQSNRLLFRVLKSAYNHYSPLLEAEEIERIKSETFDFSDSVESYTPFQLKQSSRVKFDPINGIWVAEDGSKTSFPFAVHQIHEEIIAPIVSNLMQENRVERLKIYNNIKDQKVSYLNKWHQDTEDFYGRNRAEANNLINIMRGTLSEFIAAHNTLTALQATEGSMSDSGSLDATVVKSQSDGAEVLASFDIKSKEFQKVQSDFADYMDRLKEDIDRRAEKFEFIEYYEASLRDSYTKNMSIASENILNLDQRRKSLVAFNPLFAESADLPPEPKIEDITGEHLALNLKSIAKNSLEELENLTVPPPNFGVNLGVDYPNVAPPNGSAGITSPESSAADEKSYASGQTDGAQGESEFSDQQDMSSGESTTFGQAGISTSEGTLSEQSDIPAEDTGFEQSGQSPQSTLEHQTQVPDYQTPVVDGDQDSFDTGQESLDEDQSSMPENQSTFYDNKEGVGQSEASAYQDNEEVDFNEYGKIENRENMEEIYESEDEDEIDSILAELSRNNIYAEKTFYEDEDGTALFVISVPEESVDKAVSIIENLRI